jgi:hypothetical protein
VEECGKKKEKRKEKKRAFFFFVSVSATKEKKATPFLKPKMEQVKTDEAKQKAPQQTEEKKEKKVLSNLKTPKGTRDYDPLQMVQQPQQREFFFFFFSFPFCLFFVLKFTLVHHSFESCFVDISSGSSPSEKKSSRPLSPVSRGTVQ